MDKQNTEELLKRLKQCVETCCSILNDEKLQELEQPFKELERLLKEASIYENIATEYYYYTAFFHGVNAELYQKSGQISKMKSHFLKQKEALEQFEARIPLNKALLDAPMEVRVMTLHCANFAMEASLAMETLDVDVAFQLALQTARLYDWLWIDLVEEASLPAVEIHLKLASLYILFKDDQDESRRQLEIVRNKYLELYQRTGNHVYLEKSQNTALGVSDESIITEELLKKQNPYLASLYRAAKFLDTATKAMDEDDSQAAFYFEKAAREAAELIKLSQHIEVCKVAASSFFGAVLYLKDSSPEFAKEMATHGLYVCELLEKNKGSDFSAKEINVMRKEFKKIVADKKPGILKRIFGH